MKKNALRKDFFMEIKKSRARFLSIFFIVAMGVAFFSGIQSSSPDMRYTGDAFFDAQKLMDLRVISTLGLNEENLAALSGLPGVSVVEGGYGLDVLSTVEDRERVIHLESLGETLNQVALSEGRLPTEKGECFLDEAFAAENGLQVGDTLAFRMDGEEDEDSDGEKLLQVSDYQIVGLGHSPLYISFNRGNTTLGTGEVDGFAYVLRENFLSDYYTQAYLEVKGAPALTSYTDLYDNLVEKIAGEVEGLEEAQCQVRYDEVWRKADEEIRDAEEELADGKKEAKKELAKARKELRDAQKELEDGKEELADGKAQLEDGKAELASGRAQLAAARKQVQNGEAALADAKAQLEKGEAELAKAKETLDASQKEADEAKAQLDAGLAKIDAGKAQLAKEEQAYQSGLAQRNARAEQLAEARASLEAARVQYEQAVASGAVPSEQLEQMQAQLTRAEAEIAAGETALAEADARLAEGKAALDAARAQLQEQEAPLAAAREEWEAGAAKLALGWEEYNANAAQTAAGKEEIKASEEQLAAGRAQIAANESKLAAGEQEIVQNEEKLRQAEEEIDQGEKELADGKEEYKKAKKEADEEIADGEEAIAKAREKLEEIEKPQWLISDRHDLPEYSDYGGNADRIRNIGRVFPVLFFLVAALISLTTMTRMVEEQRTLIGTMKALGYGKYAIASKYLNYAFLATVGGSVLGVLIGEKVLPYIIIKAYGIMYHNMATHMTVRYEWKYALLASVVAVVCTVGATLSSCYRELMEAPAALMRPPAPREGKRVLVERLSFFWKHLSFTWKSTLRNLFRYKKRFFMTIFGVGGCMALLLIGYGLQDSIMDIARLQYGELQLYDGLLVGDEDAAEKERQQLFAYLEKEKGENIQSYTPLLFHTMRAKKEKVNVQVNLYVAKDGPTLAQDVTIRERGSDEPYVLTDTGAALSEKTAKLLGLQAGDPITLTEDDGTTVSIPVAYIMENYMSHYLYMTGALYRETFDQEPVYGDALITLTQDAPLTQEELGKRLLEYPAALSISYTSSIAEQLERMLTSLEAVIVVLIVSAGMLAFVVLYNLNNINITERKRELATLKVLGFYDQEVSQYVFRENLLLTVFGIMAGVVMGTLLHRYVITTVEVDAAMFGRQINGPSFLYSALFTCGFSLCVNLLMYFRLKKIDMVESLKSVE